MMDMAIGVIIGGAFSTLVTSLTDNLISPILGILGKVNFDAMMWDVFGDGKLVFKYGAFITAVINFLIMAFVLFCIVKAMNKGPGMPGPRPPGTARLRLTRRGEIHPSRAVCRCRPNKNRARLFALRGQKNVTPFSRRSAFSARPESRPAAPPAWGRRGQQAPPRNSKPLP